MRLFYKEYLGMIDKDAFLAAAALAARQVGIVARRLQGQIRDEGKEVDLSHTGGDAYLARQKQAKTAVDEMAQDILITALAPHLPLHTTVLDGEEETPGKALMPATDGEYVLVLDPIDGTVIYLDGGQTYAVNIGLFRNGAVEVALLYFPALDVAYFTTGQGAFRARGVALHGLAQKEEVFLANQPDNPRKVFVYYGIREEIAADLEAAGYTIARSLNRGAGEDLSKAYSDPVDAMFRGGVAAGIVGRIQVRDMIHAAILTCTQGGYVTDWQGQPYRWPQAGGELPKIVVSGWQLPDDLKDILARHA